MAACSLDEGSCAAPLLNKLNLGNNPHLGSRRAQAVQPIYGRKWEKDIYLQKKVGQNEAEIHLLGR